MTRPAHPTDGVELRERELPGPWSRGVPAADIGTAQGSDGRWYVRWGIMTPTGGQATPIGHSAPFDSETAAIEAAVARIRASAARVIACDRDHYNDTDKKWARRIEAWCVDQVAPTQGAFDL